MNRAEVLNEVLDKGREFPDMVVIRHGCNSEVARVVATPAGALFVAHSGPDFGMSETVAAAKRHLGNVRVDPAPHTNTLWLDDDPSPDDPTRLVGYCRQHGNVQLERPAIEDAVGRFRSRFPTRTVTLRLS